MITPEEIRNRIETGLPGAGVQVTDLTGGGDHYRVIVVAAQFEELGAVERHRKVYALFKDVIGGELHALSLDTRTPQETQKTGDDGGSFGPGRLPSL